MEGSRPFDSELDFDHPRRNRPEPPPPLRASRRHGDDDSGEPPKRGRSETIARIAWAIPWIAVAVTIVIVGGELFAAAMVGLACVGIFELFRMTARRRPFLLTAFVVAAALVATAFYGDQYEMMIALAASVALIFISAVARPDRDGITISVAVTVLGIVWIARPVRARRAAARAARPRRGAARRRARRHLRRRHRRLRRRAGCSDATASPRSSRRTRPSRASPSASSAVPRASGSPGLYQDWLPGLDALVMGFCIAVLAPLGDLFESMIKRDLQIEGLGHDLRPPRRACSTASTPSCSRSSPATTSRSRWSTERRRPTRPRADPRARPTAGAPARSPPGRRRARPTCG